MIAWEYLVLTAPTDWQLNQAGAAGWELVQVTQPHYAEPRVAYFKRPKVDK